ncbi:MAG: septum formation initiator family protein [Clostridia bacterium]|nr:septum formation initiator family protein [Clostridia bacterium]
MNIKKIILSFVMNNRRKLIIGGFALLVCSMIFKGIMQQPQIYANKQRIAELEEKIAYEKTRQIEIDELSEKVNTDEYIEKIAREKLGLVKNNSKIFIDVSSED